MRKHYFIAFLSFLIVSASFGQDYFSISDGGSHIISCTVDSIIVTDGGGVNGNYQPGQTHSITFCLDAGQEGNLEVVISPALFGDTWDVDAGSFISVHNGSSPASPMIGGGNFNTLNDPAGIRVRTTQGCITLVFTTGATSTGAGFTAHVLCESAFQPFLVELESDPPFVETSVDPLSITICYTDSFSVTANTQYPLSDASGNGYAQSDATSYFNWQMGDGTNFMGFGLNEISYAYAGGAGHEVNLSIIDASGTIQYYRFYVLHSPRPDFSNIAIDDTLCIGSQTVITGGINIFQQDTVGVASGTGSILGGGAIGAQETIHDADPPTCPIYSLPLIINEFEEGQVLEDINDIFDICVNMHHTFLGDLEMGLVCPGGQDTLVLFDMRYTSGQCPNLFPGGVQAGGRDLGQPNAQPIPIGFDYCFNNNPQFGTFADVNGSLPASQSMPAGSYEPMSPMEDLLGCPLNGEWQLLIRDGWNANVGVLNSWSIYFNPDINPSTKYYTPTIVSAGWDENDDLIVNEDSLAVTVAPSQEGDNSFTFWAYDEFGCRHDTTINIYVRPNVILGDAIACDLEHIFNPKDELDNPITDGAFTVLSAPTSTAELLFEQTETGVYQAVSNEYGVYLIEMMSSECAYTDTATFDYRPDPTIEPFEAITALCPDNTLILDAGPQSPNSQNFQITWTSSHAGVFNVGDLAVTIDTTGIYYLAIVGYCASAFDTTDVSILVLEYEGNTVCGLESAANVKVAPPGPGLWTGPPNINFSHPTMFTTEISSTTHGIFEITYTDERCPEDGLVREFNFVEPPQPVITPENPDFCVDKDPLVLVATVGGSFNGLYNWSVNGENILGANDTLYFAPNYFDPLEDYLIEVTAFDAYNRCPPEVGSANFTGKWCEFHIPNVITPNSDGKNDRFYVNHMEKFPGTHLRIFDRWGRKVFDQPDYDQYQKTNRGWHPEDLEAGTYFYELLIPNVDKIESGYIQILKEKQ